MTEIPKPLVVTRDTVTLSRRDFDTLIEALEDSQDRAAVRESLARQRKGKDDCLPASLYRRILKGEHPVRVWRAYRGFGLNPLARQARLSPSYLSEMEKGTKPGSLAAMRALAEALSVDLDDLVR